MVLQGIILAWLLKRIWDYLSPETKTKLKQLVPMHHGELGFWKALAGVLLKNPNLISGGITLMIDDWHDKPLWVEDIKRRIISILNNAQNPRNQFTLNYNYYQFGNQNYTLNVSNEAEKVKNWLSNKKREILQNIQNNTGLNYQPKYHW